MMAPALELLANQGATRARPVLAGLDRRTRESSLNRT